MGCRHWIPFRVPRFRAGLLLAAWGAANLAAGALSHPNVLFIAVDDLRPELGCYGVEYVKSPNIDRLAARGVLFERAYCQYAICGPSRASLLTGMRPDSLKIEDIDTYFRKTVPDVVTLPQHFKANGYTAVYYGKVFYARQEDEANSWNRRPAGTEPARDTGGEYQLPENRALVHKRREAALKLFGANGIEGLASGPAWESADRPDSAYGDGRTTDAALLAMKKLSDSGRPFFLAVGFRKPHLPFIAPKRYFDLYDAVNIPLADTPFAPTGAPGIARHQSFELRTRSNIPTSGPVSDDLARELRRAYAACTSFVDAQVGRLLERLDELGLSKNTIIVFWGDHGWHLGEEGMWGKATDYEVATRAPLIVAVPGAKGNGSKASGLVEFVDIYPTLCRLAGLPLPGSLEGTSFAPLLETPGRSWKKAAFSQFPSPALREWAARPLSLGMRRTFFGPLIAGVEAQLKEEYGSRYEQATFDREVMGYTMRTERYRFTVWVDRREPEGEPYSVEVYDHLRDPSETRNVANVPDYAAVVAGLRAQWLQGWRSAQPDAH
ncbi:MAG: sulfatase [Opitutaceae bacterium]|nr:sulfatase [Opitutaceae bacterium]